MPKVRSKTRPKDIYTKLQLYKVRNVAKQDSDMKRISKEEREIINRMFEKFIEYIGIALQDKYKPKNIKSKHLGVSKTRK